MEITYAPKGRLQIDNCRIIYRNFKGVGSKFNREGDRNFSVIIPTQEQADELIEAGWNVKIKPAREPGEDPFRYLPVKIKFSDYGPAIYLVSGRTRVKLTEASVGAIDEIDIAEVSLDLRPYDWEMNGQTGRAAYLESMCVTQRTDRFAAMMDDYPGEAPGAQY